ncbi:MAG: chemotaxis protein [Oscillospiraceae bacterium]
MEFTISGELFGINVAKVREIIRAQKIKKMPNSNPVVEGVFKPREDIITVVDLGKYLNLSEFKKDGHDIFIVTYFNNLHFAFHVESVVGIDRISWTSIKKPDKAIYGGNEGAATGIAEFQDRLITILDFEKIIAEISPESSIQVESINELGKRSDSEKTILIAEDSMLLAKLIMESLHKSGYKKIVKTENGQEAWDFLLEVKKLGDKVKNHIDCIVTDIEMPLMDGHRLTKLIKDDSVLKEIPVILFSSLISNEMRVKGKQLGADEQISKPEIANLVSVIDRLTQTK